MSAVADKAGEEYWSRVWEHSELPEAISPSSRDINKYPYRRIHQYFKEKLSGMETQGKTLLEVGCGNSVWLTYFAKEFGFKVYGIDYSEYGCEQTKAILKRDGVEGEIYCADLFSPPEPLLGCFDFVISLGVAEHFSDTSNTLAGISKFLKPGGILITTVPNLSGLIGFLQKKFNRPVYDIHIPMDKKHLGDALVKAGLKIINIKYLISIGFPLTLEGKNGTIQHYNLKKKIVLMLSRLGKIIWFWESFSGTFPETRLFSMAIFSIAQKPKTDKL